MTTPKPAAETPPRFPREEPPDQNGHEWIQTSDPMTPMCRLCEVREGDPRADQPCAAASLSPSPADGWGWCPNTTLRIPKGECGCCPDPDTRPAAAAPLADGAQTRRKRACVIGGFDCAIDLPLHETVGKLRAHAVEEMRERKPAETWECRDAKGYWLEPGTQLGAVAHWPIYFNQPIGWGG